MEFVFSGPNQTLISPLGDWLAANGIGSSLQIVTFFIFERQTE